MCVDVKDSCMCRGVTSVVRIVHHSFDEEDEPQFVMYVNNEVARTVMK